MRAKLVIVSNRLPVSVVKSESGFDVQPSVGGLATGLASYAGKRGTLWVGWPGLPSDDLTDADKQTITAKLKKLGCHPVFLTKQQIADFYNGYSNSVLWPIFHEQAPAEQQPRAWWQTYQEVNELFAEEALRFTAADGRVWVHDYQLLLMPALLRAADPSLQIGFFLHIPFPRTEHFERVRQHKQLLRGVLGADLAGFHTPSYCEHFLDATSSSHIGTRSSEHSVATRDHVCHVSDFPMGIDYGKFQRAVRSRSVRRHLYRLAYRYRGKKVILTVDRLDPTKGLYERLDAYRKLLEQQPALHRKVMFVMLAVPSRTEIPAYQKLRARVETLVQHINDTYGARGWRPVEYLYQSMPFEQLSALYRRADVAFIAPLQDGMNLVAKEYIASKHGRDGVLVLSSTAGAAEELTDAVMVNPKQPSSLVRGLERALTMPRTELRQRLHRMQKHLEVATVQAWAQRFMGTLRSPLAVAKARTRMLHEPQRRQLVQAFKLAERPLLLLDYDGTLAPIVRRPEDAAPTSELRSLLRKLGKRANVVILSGRSRHDLEQWLGDLPVTLVAEHGAARRKTGGKRWQAAEGLSTVWHDDVHALFTKATRQIAGSHIEQKSWAIVWHYREANLYAAQAQLLLLHRHLRLLQKRYDIAIKDGKKILEVSPASVNKGAAAQSLLSNHDFILAAGDDATDEDMLGALPASGWSIKIGRGRTAARYRVANPAEFLALLKKLS